MKKKNNTALYLSLTILALIWLVPIVTVFITSLKSNSDFFSGMGLFDLPEKLQWHNYSDAWSKGHLDRYIRNGLIVTCLKVPISVFISSLLAFALTRLHVRHARGIFIFVLIGMMLPQQAALIPLNIVYSRARSDEHVLLSDPDVSRLWYSAGNARVPRLLPEHSEGA